MAHLHGIWRANRYEDLEGELVQTVKDDTLKEEQSEFAPCIGRRKGFVALSSKQNGVFPRAALNGADALQEVYDEWFETFWREELGGERLKRELQLIRDLGRLTPGSQVLDLACAFGRIANALAEDGQRVTGVDVSRPLLASARAQAVARGVAVEYLAVDVCEFVVPPVYECALLWGTSFGHFSESGDSAVLERALASLVPGGRLLIEARHWDSMRRTFEPTTVRTSGDNFLIEHHTYDPETGIQWTRQTLLVEGRRLHREYGVRRYTFPELRSLCLRVGFAEVRGFDERGGPLQPNSGRCVLVARK